jgi:hypothetical protein
MRPSGADGGSSYAALPDGRQTPRPDRVRTIDAVEAGLQAVGQVLRAGAVMVPAGVDA